MNVSLTQSLDEQQKSALSGFVRDELAKIIDECDDVIVEYVMVMVYNGKTMQDISSELEEFVVEPHRSNFAHSLAKYIQDLESPQATSSSAPKMLSLSKKSDRPIKELRTSREGGAAPSRLLQTALQGTKPHNQNNKRTTNNPQQHQMQNNNNKRPRQEPPHMVAPPMGPPLGQLPGQPPYGMDMMPPMPPMMAPMEMMEMMAMYQQNMMSMMLQMQQQGRGRGRGGYRGRGRFPGRYNPSYHAPAPEGADEEEAPLGPIAAPTYDASRGRGSGRFHGRGAPSRGRGRTAASVNRTWVKPPTLEDSLTTER